MRPQRCFVENHNSNGTLIMVCCSEAIDNEVNQAGKTKQARNINEPGEEYVGQPLSTESALDTGMCDSRCIEVAQNALHRSAR